MITFFIDPNIIEHRDVQNLFFVQNHRGDCYWRLWKPTTDSRCWKNSTEFDSQIAQCGANQNNFLQSIVKNTSMVFIVASSSLNHALETLAPEEKERLKDKKYTIPSLSFNPNTKIPRKIVQNLLSKDLKDEEHIVIWHDVLNNSISKLDSNSFRALSVWDLIETLKICQDKLCVLVYCQRNRTPYISEELKVSQTDQSVQHRERFCICEKLKEFKDS